MEQISIVVESSLPGRSPARVSQAESPTSQTNAAFDAGIPTEPATTEDITQESSLPNLAHITQCESSTSRANLATSSMPLITELAATEEIAVETSSNLLVKNVGILSCCCGHINGTPRLRNRKRTIGMPRGSGAATADETSGHNSAPQPNLTTADGETRSHTRRLCQAALKGDWETAKSIMAKDRNLVRTALTGEGDTVLHIAVTGKCSDFIRKLVDFMEPDEMLTVNKNSDTGLHMAAVSGMLQVARLIVVKNKKLLLLRGKDDLMPLAMAIQGGHRSLVKYLHQETELDNLADEEYIRLVLDSLSSNLYGTALKLVEKRETMACERDCKTEKTALHVLAQKAPAVKNFSYVLKQIRERFYADASFAYFSNSELAESDNREEVLVKILNLVMKIQSDQDIKDLIRRPSSVIFDATMSGNVQFLAELLRKYPELLWEKDERGQSVFHVAIVYRQENVFNLIYNTGAVKDYLVGIEDSDGNNMLHLAGMTSKNKEKLSRFRANLLMQQEILWFKEVEKIVRPDQRNKKNSRGKTPREVFIKRHRRLLRGGEDTIRGTAKSCMLVATLIATVVFAAPLNVQGMNSPSKKLQSWIFALSNAAALCSSTSSIVVSLSILTSSYAQSDFLDALHRRLIIALTTLFVSIATMVAAFGAAMFVIFDDVPLLFMFTIILFAGLPVWLFLMVHGNLFADLIRSYRWSKSLFKPSVHKIFV